MSTNTYTADDGTEWCDDCDAAAVDCTCVCDDCGDPVDECACDEEA